MTKEELIKTLEEYDKEVNRLFKENKKLKSILKKVRNRMLNENKPLPSAREIIDIIDEINKEKNNEAN